MTIGSNSARPTACTAVLVDAVAEAVETLGVAGVLDDPTVSGDFLSFRHYTVERFARTMQWLDLGFIGWPGSPDDPTIRGVRDAPLVGRRRSR